MIWLWNVIYSWTWICTQTLILSLHLQYCNAMLQKKTNKQKTRTQIQRETWTCSFIRQCNISVMTLKSWRVNIQFLQSQNTGTVWSCRSEGWLLSSFSLTHKLSHAPSVVVFMGKKTWQQNKPTFVAAARPQQRFVSVLCADVYNLGRNWKLCTTMVPPWNILERLLIVQVPGWEKCMRERERERCLCWTDRDAFYVAIIWVLQI